MDVVVARLDALKAKLCAREGRKEFAENCAAIRDEIAKLEARMKDATT